MTQWTEKITDELLFARQFSIKTTYSAKDCAERIELLAAHTRGKQNGFSTHIHVLPDNRYRVLMYAQRFPAKSRTAELKGYVIANHNGYSVFKGKVRFTAGYYLGAILGLVFSVFVGLLLYDVLNFGGEFAFVSIIQSVLFTAIFWILPVFMLYRVYTDRNHLLKTFSNTLHS